ncbi:MAG: amidohydrolase family protein [Planctomycetota bacterium]
MITTTILLGALSVAVPQDKTELPPVYALRVGVAETVSGGTVENAVLLVENGKITVLGEDLPVERGIPTIDKPDWVVMPGLVNCYSRIGLSGRGSSSFDPHVMASDEIYPRSSSFMGMLEAGVTTVALYPAGSGIPGQSVALRPHGSSLDDMLLRDSAYLKVVLRSNVKSKKMLMDGFGKADEHGEKVEKAREKWEKDLEKAKKKKKSKKDDDDDDKKEDDKDKVPEVFTPPDADPKVQPFLDLRTGELTALIDISKAADYLHLLDALGDEEITFSVHCELRDDIDLYEITERFGEAGLRVVLEPEVTFQPWTRRDRNLPAEFVAAGAKLALVPTFDNVSSFGNWRVETGHLVKAGLDRQTALRAMTLEPAEVLGLADRVGSLEAGKDANLILLDGDPLEPSSKVQMVILEGKNVYEYEAPYSGGKQ